MSRALAHASVFHAIADPTRRAILDVLREGDSAVAAILEAVGSTPSALSQHLGVLRRARLVRARRRGRTRVYSVRAEPLHDVSAWIAHFDKFWDDRLERLGEHLDRRAVRAGEENAP